MALNTDPNLESPDDFYEMLVEAHRDLSPDQSRMLNAKLILLLANHVGSIAVLAEAVTLAKTGLGPTVAEDDLRFSA